MSLEFKECDTCKEAPTSSFICQGCAHNRYVINRLKGDIEYLQRQKTYTTMYEGRPVYKADDIQGDSQYDWMEQDKFKYQRDDLVEWKSKSGISSGVVIEGFQVPDQVYYSVCVEAGGYELVVSVPEKELKKVV